MRILQIISELRRNPEQNIKEIGHPAALAFLQSKGRDIRNYGVSMTTLPKLGINPGSRYNTPVGIYFYPADYYVRAIGRGKELEFQHDAPYIQILELKGNVETISELSHSVYSAYVKRLYENASKIATLINKSEKETTNLISQSVLDARSNAKEDSYGGHLWYLLYTLSFYAGKEKRSNAPPRSSVVWNAILRLLGIDGLIDEGGGIIHENEPYQGVVLDPRSIKHVNTFKNTVEDVDKSGMYFKHLAATPVTAYYVENVIEAISNYNLAYTNKYKNECNIIMENVLRYFESDPGLYSRLGANDIFMLLRLTGDNNVKQRLVVDFYAQKFPKLQADLNDMIEMWEEYKAQPGWDAVPVSRKQRAFALSAPPNKVRYAQDVMQHLTTYKADPKASQMIKFITDALARLQ